jgi:hypothetical protein
VKVNSRNTTLNSPCRFSICRSKSWAMKFFIKNFICNTKNSLPLCHVIVKRLSIWIYSINVSYSEHCTNSQITKFLYNNFNWNSYIREDWYIKQKRQGSQFFFTFFRSGFQNSWIRKINSDIIMSTTLSLNQPNSFIVISLDLPNILIPHPPAKLWKSLLIEYHIEVRINYLVTMFIIIIIIIIITFIKG